MLRWMSAAELATLWRMPVERVRVWAVRYDWPRTRTRPYRYDPVLAQETYERLATPEDRRVTGVD